MASSETYHKDTETFFYIYAGCTKAHVLEYGMRASSDSFYAFINSSIVSAFETKILFI